MVETLHDKFTTKSVSLAQLKELIYEHPESDRALAIALLQHSAPNLSETALLDRLRALRSVTPLVRYFVAGSASPGNMLGYLFCRANGRLNWHSRGICGLPFKPIEVLQGKQIPDSIVLLEDLSTIKLNSAAKDVLQRIPDVNILDLNAFDKGVNLIDLSLGVVSIRQKLAKLTKEAKSIRDINPRMTPQEVATQVLDGAVETAATKLGANFKVIRPPQVHDLKTKHQSEPDPVKALHAEIVVPRASKEDIASYIANLSRNQRLSVATLLTDTARFHSFPSMTTQALGLHRKMQHANTLQKFDGVVVATLAALPRGLRTVRKTSVGDNMKPIVVASDSYKPYRSLRVFADRVFDYLGVENRAGYGGTRAVDIWPYMTPDNSLVAIRKFSADVLKIGV